MPKPRVRFHYLDFNYQIHPRIDYEFASRWDQRCRTVFGNDGRTRESDAYAEILAGVNRKPRCALGEIDAGNKRRPTAVVLAGRLPLDTRLLGQARSAKSNRHDLGRP